MDVSDLFRADGDDAAVIHIHVQPGAGRSAVVGRHGAALKVRVAAAPEGGRANDAAAALLADAFGLVRAKVELVNGASSRSKQFRIGPGLDLEEFESRLERVVAEGHPASGASGGKSVPARR